MEKCLKEVHEGSLVEFIQVCSSKSVPDRFPEIIPGGISEEISATKR